MVIAVADSRDAILAGHFSLMPPPMPELKCRSMQARSPSSVLFMHCLQIASARVRWQLSGLARIESGGFAAVREFSQANDRSGSPASILTCPRSRPLSTTPGITTSDRDPSACRLPAPDLQTTGAAAAAPASGPRSIWRHVGGAPDTIRTSDLCLRRATLVLRAQCGPKLSQLCGSDSANANPGIADRRFSLLYRRQNYDGTCSILGVARAARYFAVEANGIGKEGRN